MLPPGDFDYFKQENCGDFEQRKGNHGDFDVRAVMMVNPPDLKDVHFRRRCPEREQSEDWQTFELRAKIRVSLFLYFCICICIVVCESFSCYLILFQTVNQSLVGVSSLTQIFTRLKKVNLDEWS